MTTRLLLLGAGHAHAQVLRDWARSPVPGVEVLLLTPSPLAPYSGMVPGWLAGAYTFESICIDFAALAAAAGARLELGALTRLDPDRCQATLEDGRVLGYDLLSVNVGSTLVPPAGLGTETTVLPLRPLGALRQRWDALMARPPAGDGPQGPLRITAVGGGAAGVEALLAVLATWRRRWPAQAVQARLVTRGPLLPGMAPGARRAANAALQAAGVEALPGTAFNPTSDPPPHLLLWATGAQAHAWQAGSGLAVSDTGFIRIDRQLRSVSHPQVLAVGDCAAWTQPLPKAGVFAVRMGPVLSHNLRGLLSGQPLHDYHPQRRYLALLATADGRAIGAWGPASAHGRWLYRWKDHIDRQFLAQFARPGRPRASEDPAA